MVVWLFAGGGESEVRGLIPFLQKNFACTFERKTPIRRKPGPKPSVNRGYGHTGRSLARQIEIHLPSALKQGQCDLILIIDDLDCRNEQQQKHLFLQTLHNLIGELKIPIWIGFAAPEIEAWLIADWDNTIARHIDFRHIHQAMRWSLSAEHNVSFDTPETFSEFDPDKDSCQDKLSDEIIAAAEEIFKIFKIESYSIAATRY